ncbi:hypothetical protein YC2023_077792 [Brassica napus]
MENLTPWLKLLPCRDKDGMSALMNRPSVYGGFYHSQRLHLSVVDSGEEGLGSGMLLEQTLTVVLQPDTVEKNIQPSWSLSSLFGRKVVGKCVLAKSNNVYLQMEGLVHPEAHTLWKNEESELTMKPDRTLRESSSFLFIFNIDKSSDRVQANWNCAKIITEKEVMNFTIQRFLNPSICEYPTLEEDSSSMKERPEAKPITEVNRSLSSFHKAQDQEKWPRKLGVMINSPEPAKPTSSMESLQPIQLGSTQSYLWEPGDHLNQSRGIPEVLSCTRIQEISWFNGESLKPNRSYLWKDWTIFRFDPFQAIPIQPGEPDDVQKKPRHPRDIIHEPEEFYNFIPCTSPHRNKKISIITKLPYLESQALKLQQLFFLQSMHDISTFQTIKKIPRKLTYPLKPSRYKEDTIYIHLAKILIIKPPTASFQGAINSFASKFIISILFLSLCHFMTVRESLVEPIKL